MKSSFRLCTICTVFILTLFFFLSMTPSAHATASIWINKGNTSEKVIALTIDDGSDGENYAKILQVLDKHKVKATFFLTGQGTENHPQNIRNTVAKGHEVGNHSYNHPNFTKISATQMKTQLSRTESIVKKTSGKTTKPYFRAPYGTLNSSVLQTVGNEGYRYTFHWTIDTLDWTGNSATAIYNRVMNSLKPGVIILMHTGYGAKNTPTALERLIPAIKNKGYRFVTLSELMKQTRTPTSPTYTIRAGDTLYSIAKRNNTTIAKIAQMNSIKNVNLIRIGQVLLIPGKITAPDSKPSTIKTYTIKRGDTLYSIAKKYNTTVVRLAQINHIKNVNLIRIGQIIRLP